jgi:putative FmdB family regulatory protein
MPIYDFRCERCGLRFEARQSIPEHDQNRPECPRCHTDERVISELSVFVAITDPKWT